MNSIQGTADDLRAACLLDQRTTRRFDKACLTPVRPMTGRDVRALREREGVSQAALARCLNVSDTLVSRWENGTLRPKGAALKLLALAARDGLAAVA